MREAERAASGEYSAPKGDLVVTAPVVFGRLHVLPVAIEFLKIYPDIDIRIVLAEDRVFSLFEDKVDLAVRIGALPDSSLVATRWLNPPRGLRKPDLLRQARPAEKSARPWQP